jgi:hypothetical protein
MNKRPGRPSLDAAGGPSTQIGVRLSPKEFDALYQRATKARVTLAELVRQELRVAAARDRK